MENWSSDISWKSTGLSKGRSCVDRGGKVAMSRLHRHAFLLARTYKAHLTTISIAASRSVISEKRRRNVCQCMNNNLTWMEWPGKRHTEIDGRTEDWKRDTYQDLFDMYVARISSGGIDSAAYSNNYDPVRWAAANHVLQSRWKEGYSYITGIEREKLFNNIVDSCEFASPLAPPLLAEDDNIKYQPGHW